MDASCPRCGDIAVSVDPYEWERRDGVTDRVHESYKEVYWNGMTLFACLASDCGTFFLVHPKDA